MNMDTKGFSRTKAASKTMQAKDGLQRLELAGVIGLNGKRTLGAPPRVIEVNLGQPPVPPGSDGLEIYLIRRLWHNRRWGSTIVVKHVTESKQYFLQDGGHDGEVSALCLSKYGKFLASGQNSTPGFPAPVIIWDMETCVAMKRLTLHKGMIRDLSISYDEKFVCSLGGQDDNNIVVWDMLSGVAICGAPSGNQTSITLRWVDGRNDLLVSAGKNGSAKIWTFDYKHRKLIQHQISLGSMRRNFLCSLFSEDAKFLFLGTSSGDIFKINTETKLFRQSGPSNRKKNPLGKGILSIIRTRQKSPNHIIVGAGDGTIALMEMTSMKIIRKTKFEGGITSLALNAAGDHFFVGTTRSNTYLVSLADFDYELRATCDYMKINDVAFARGYSDLFATCSNGVRLWNAKERNELLRIEVNGLICHCVVIAPDGKSIVTGWEDGKIRAFTPTSGKLMYAINHAHKDAVTALAITNDSKRIISGGTIGHVRIWGISKQTQTMIASMKQHKGAVNSIMVDDTDNHCVTAASDGSCIIWNLNQYNRESCLYAITKFKSAVYHPEMCQLLTSGTDRKVTFWDVVSANEIRITECTKDGDVNDLAISPDGEWFASVGNDRVLRLWGYDDAECHYIGQGHSGFVTAVKISPDQKFIVTVGSEGAIFLWKMPSECLPAEIEEKNQVFEKVASESKKMASPSKKCKTRKKKTVSVQNRPAFR
ncbi:hypothetical protein AAMO2058_000960000 [Amorphochlora amoebiformis]